MAAPSRTYQALVNDIAQVYTQTRASVVRMYWEIGRRIVEVEQAGESRAEYGGWLLARLSTDLTTRFGGGFSERNLLRMRTFYQQHKISPPAAELGWSHQTELLSLPDANLRRQLAKRAQGRELTRNELRALVQQARRRLDGQTTDGAPAVRPATSSHHEPPRLLKPKRGTPGLFRIAELARRRYLDVGFESYWALSEAQAQRLKAGDVVRRARDGTLRHVPEATAADLYTYEAQVERVVDGDTMWTLIRLTESEWRREKLRLRGIDCPELGTAAGDAAKRFVQAQAARAASLVITTTKPDKWDRYLSDVFLTMPDGAEVFLNNRLLELGHARPYEDVSLKDWET